MTFKEIILSQYLILVLLFTHIPLFYDRSLKNSYNKETLNSNPILGKVLEMWLLDKENAQEKEVNFF